MTTLRAYQAHTLDQAEAHHATGIKRVLAVLPTAAGKTVLFSEAARRRAARGMLDRVLVLAHRVELVRQAADKMTAAGLPPAIIGPHTPWQASRILVGSIQTVSGMLDRLPPISLIIPDEAHHCVSNQWRKLFDSQPGADVLGVTATPERLDGRGLGETFQVMVVAPGTSVAELTAAGWLSPVDALGVPRDRLADLSKARKRAGDFAAEDVAEAMSKPWIVGDAVEHYGWHAPGQPAIAFCSSVANAATAAEAFRAAGWRSVAVDGTTRPDVRDRSIGGLATGEVEVLCSCSLIDEGVDVPALGAVIDLAPTASLTKWKQRVGRGMRVVYAPGFDLNTAPGRRAAIASGGKPVLTYLDHAGNTWRHGYVDDDHKWSLAGRPKREATLSVCQCPACYAFHRPARTCRYCGHDYAAAAAAAERRAIEIREGELARMTPEDRRLLALRSGPLKDLLKGADRKRLEEVALARGYDSRWIDIQAGFRRFPGGTRYARTSGEEFS